MDDILDEKTYETRKLQYASFTLRTAAFLIDLLLIVTISYGIYYVFQLAQSYMAFLQYTWWKIIPVIILYYLYFEGSESNASIGKQIMNIRMLKEDRIDIDFTDSAKHLFFSMIFFFAYFSLLSNEKRQTMADKICKVMVIKV